jgi:gamma-glutamylcyclotransferase (GGCT)/AIG2-like uncharacterized protein YtfP
MSQRQMLERCPNSSIVGPGLLHGYRLYFGSYASTWKGAVADVSKSEDSGTSVPVIIYNLPDSDLKLLDYYEGYPMKYKRKKVNVTLRNGKKVIAWIYFLSPAHEGQFGAPSHKYYEQIRRAYLRFRFNERYLEKARAISEELGNELKTFYSEPGGPVHTELDNQDAEVDHSLGEGFEDDPELQELLKDYSEEDYHTDKSIDDIFREFEADE